MFEQKALVRVSAAREGKSVRVFPVGGGAFRALDSEAPFAVVQACVKRFGSRGEVSRLTRGDWVHASFSSAELRAVGR